jgi:DNA-binding transcriptional regulator LsrR (DeoR family)
VTGPIDGGGGETRALLHTVAKLHYEADLPQVQIARQLGLSTATISRLLQRARAEGIVRIEVRDLVAPDALGAEVARRLGLRRVSVIESPAGAAPVALAAPLGALLRDLALAPGAVLVIGWGRAIHAVLEAGLPPMPGVRVVPAIGGLQQQQPYFQINEHVRVAAAQIGGEPYFIHAPNLPSAESRPIFLADPAIRSAVALWDRIDVAVVGVGLPPPVDSSEASVATRDERMIEDPAGDVVRHYFDLAGRPIPWAGEERMIAVSPAQLRAARLCVAVAAGPAKAAGIVGAARAGLIGALVTDAQTAEAILDLLAATPA